MNALDILYGYYMKRNVVTIVIMFFTNLCLIYDLYVIFSQYETFCNLMNELKQKKTNEQKSPKINSKKQWKNL